MNANENSIEEITNWHHTYDSLYVVNDININYKYYPCLVVKEYTQQYPLSYHITKINKSDICFYEENDYNNFYIQ